MHLTLWTFVFIVCAQAPGLLKAQDLRTELWNILKKRNGNGRFLPGPAKTKITLSTDVKLITMSDFDPKVGYMRLGYWLQLQWIVPTMAWNITKYPVTVMHVPVQEIWIPDIVPYKHVDSEISHESRALIYSNGFIIWVPHILSKVICEGMKEGPNFPHDRYKCILKVGSWVYDGYTVNMTYMSDGLASEKSLVKSLDSKPLESSGWRFISASAKRYNKYYPCCKEPYPSIEVGIIIERSDVYFGLAVATPGVVTGLLLAILYLVSPGSPARIVAQSVCLLIFVFVGVTDLRLMGTALVLAPAARYYVAAMIFNLFALAWSIVVGLVWLQSADSPGQNMPSPRMADTILRRLECLCLLPSPTQTFDNLEMTAEGEDHIVRRPQVFGLSTKQRLCLALDRIFCVLTIFIFVLCFFYLSG